MITNALIYNQKKFLKFLLKNNLNVFNIFLNKGKST